MIAVSLNTNIYVCLFFNTRFLLFKVSLKRYRNTIHLCLCIMFLANLLVLVIMLSYSNACSICWMLAEFFFIISVFVFICWCILSHAKKVMRHNQRQTYTLLAYSPGMWWKSIGSLLVLYSIFQCILHCLC